MPCLPCPDRIIVSTEVAHSSLPFTDKIGATQRHAIYVTCNIPDRFEDVYSHPNHSKGASINLPNYVALTAKDIEQHKILIYLIHRIVSIREFNYFVKREDDIIDEITAYNDTIMHFGTDAVIDYVDNTHHCEVFAHLMDVLRLYTLNGYHEAHPDLYDVTILTRYPGKMFIPEISI